MPNPYYEEDQAVMPVLHWNISTKSEAVHTVEAQQAISQMPT
jgi:hypothetical protein